MKKILFIFLILTGVLSCKSTDQSIPETRFVVSYGNHEMILDADTPVNRFITEGERFSWEVIASDPNRLQRISFFYKNLKLDFPDGLDGIDVKENTFFVGEQKVNQIIFNFSGYYTENSVSGQAVLMKDSRAILRNGSFYNITSRDLDIPQNHDSRPLTMTVE